ncbi:FAD/NAD(P)-binding domain-containing protein [Dendrothele bispora CBS 962.96]|uniref:FAD/NAD(P)-binding domain-containing protein n=1 Tax=Dendrothele bispora (strain CBS 962.96) TaxID=1314807 RepID=A0A4S8LUY7_DENBC|nr:FAD/NAD(P)-binding domain-containing protein [Dendrothele bispora CBS 962.96]
MGDASRLGYLLLPFTGIIPELNPLADGNDIKICIIGGGGAAGLASLKTILDSPQFKRGAWQVTAYEAREGLGGVWLPAPPTSNPPATPMYDSLTTNLPHPVMAFSSFWFPPSTPVYPKAVYVQRYLEAYAEHYKLKPYIKLNTQVQNVTRIQDSVSSKKKWKAELSTGETELFDFVMVCNGHYNEPRYPAVLGVGKWLEAGKAIHSAWYRSPESIPGKMKKILIVGAGPSGSDITHELGFSDVAETVLHSITGGGGSQDSNRVQMRDRVVEFRGDDEVLFGDGTIEKGVDFVILATGYQYTFPFFKNSGIFKNGIPPAVPPIPGDLWDSTYNVFPLAKHLFPLSITASTGSLVSSSPDPSLAFLCLLVRVAPFPVLEAQARAVVHVFGNPHTLDSTREAVDVVSRYEELRIRVSTATGSIKDEEHERRMIAHIWHKFEGHQQFDYRDELYAFADASQYPNSGPDAVEGISGRVLVEPWEKVMCDETAILRRFWVELEKRGEAESWLKGVGESGGDEGRREWVTLLERMLKAAREEEQLELKDEDHRKARL